MRIERLLALRKRILNTDRYRPLMLVVAALAVIRSTQIADTSVAIVGLWLVLATLAWPRVVSRGSNSGDDLFTASKPIDDRLGTRALGAQLCALEQATDPLLRSLAALKLVEVRREVDALAHGTVFFRDTEGWRAAYAELLLSHDVTEYRSVAWVVNEDYWRDLPGEHSLRTNFEALDQGVSVERICILGWNLWPPELSVPLLHVLNWINDQHYRGIAIFLVRETDLMAEPDLLRDFGIYGHRATGEQRLDRHARTVGFTLSFDPADVALARDRWRRLKLFVQKYQELMDRAGTPI